MDQHLITRIVEAALLAAHQPLTLAQLHGLFPEDAPAPADSVEQALETLREDCAGRGVELVELASGFRYQVQADVHSWVARLWTERQTRYTRATLETLALIAYRQPITRGEIEQVRGVAVSSNIIRALEEREWIRVVGHRDVPGKPALFGTTKTFLDYFGLKRLDQLPPLSELKDLGELEPQLQFEGSAGKSTDAGAIAAGGIGADAADEAGESGHADAQDTSAGEDDPAASPGDLPVDAASQDVPAPKAAHLADPDAGGDGADPEASRPDTHQDPHDGMTDRETRAPAGDPTEPQAASIQDAPEQQSND